MGNASRAAISQERAAAHVRQDADSMSLQRIALRAIIPFHAAAQAIAAAASCAILTLNNAVLILRARAHS